MVTSRNMTLQTEEEGKLEVCCVFTTPRSFVSLESVALSFYLYCARSIRHWQQFCSITSDLVHAI